MGTELGLIYKIDLSGNENIKFGLSYSTEISFSKSYTVGNNHTLYTDTTRNISYHVLAQNLLLRGDIPGHLNFDFDISKIPQIEILGSIKDIFWSQIKPGIRDQFELSGSMVYNLNHIFKPSVGFYLSDYNLKDDFFGINKEMNVFYITAGLQIIINPISVDLSLADSHWLSGEFRKQTIIKAGIGLNI